MFYFTDFHYLVRNEREFRFFCKYILKAYCKENFNHHLEDFTFPAIISYNLPEGSYIGKIRDIVSLDEFINPVEYRKYNSLVVKKRYVKMLEKALKDTTLFTKQHNKILNEVQARLSEKEINTLAKQKLGPKS